MSVTDKEFLSYYTKLDEPQKRSLLELIKTFLNGSGSELVERDTIISYNQALEEAMIRIENGEFTTMEDLEKEMQSW